MLNAVKFGKYEIVRKLSRSMTDVYMAIEASSGRQVVLKLIEESKDEFTKVAIEAEKRGAQLQKQLHTLDSRILEVYDFGEQEKCFFVALEYFEGQTLAEILNREKRVDSRRSARYAAEICSQLKTLHAFVSDVNGRQTAVVHGDIKPTNIQIGARDELKLLDFGIAKMITATHNLTRHNLGSPSYCSPERLSSSQVDIHSDLWALGVTLFEMLSGAPPYQAQDTRRLENLIQSRRPPRALPEEIPASLRAIVSKALAGDINHRYHSATDFEKDLRSYIDWRDPVAAAEKPSWESNATVQKSRPTVMSPPSVPPARAVQNPTKLTKNPTKLAQKSFAVAGKAPPVPAQSSPGSAKAKPAAVAVKLRLRSRFHASSLAVAHLAGILAGLLMLLPVVSYYRLDAASSPLRSKRDYAHQPLSVLSSDWVVYKALKDQGGWMGPFSPLSVSELAFEDNLIHAADNILDGYRASSETRLSAFDWNRARQCLRYAAELKPSDGEVKGKLAITEGYYNMVQNPKLPRAKLSIDDFRQAASYLPKSPEPHLGLARLYVESFRNVGAALPEFQQAQRLGYQLGPREASEEADGYFYRSEWELAHARKANLVNNGSETDRWLSMSKADADRASGLYEPLVGYSNVNANLEQIYQDRAEQERISSAVASHAGFHKWQ